MRVISLIVFLLFCYPANCAFAEMILTAYTADWCGPCSQFKRAIAQNPEIIADYTLVIVDVDREAAKAKKNKINSLPTFIITNEDETEISRITGYNPRAFSAWLQRHKAAIKSEH